MRYVESLNQALHGLLADQPEVCLIGEDLLDPYGGAFKVAKGLSTAYPDQVMTTPISEAGLTGVAIGMALRGFRPIVEIMFGDFLMLTADQIVNHATKFGFMYNDQVTVPLTIRTPMGGHRGYGPTHSQTLEAMFLGVPGLTILAPSHYHAAGELLSHVVRTTEQPVLFIENKMLYPERLIEPDQDGRAGDFAVRRIAHVDQAFPTLSLSMDPGTPPDVTLVAYGGMANMAVEAAFRAFMSEEIMVEVLLPSRISPVPSADLLPSASRSGRLLVVEEGVTHGGWGAEVGCRLQEELRGGIRVGRVGSAAIPIPSSKTMEAQVLPSVEAIVSAILRLHSE